MCTLYKHLFPSSPFVLEFRQQVQIMRFHYSERPAQAHIYIRIPINHQTALFRISVFLKDCHIYKSISVNTCNKFLTTIFKRKK